MKYDVVGNRHSGRYDTMLAALNNLNIMHVEVNKTGGFDIWEGCDSFYFANVTPDQLRALGEELIALSHTVKPT